MHNKILITGGCGYIGSHTLLKLIESGYEPIILDDLSNSSEAVIERLEAISGKKICIYKCSITDVVSLNQIFASNDIDSVIHFAGLKSVNESIDKPYEYYNVNVTGTLNLISAMINHCVKNFIFSSSASIYGPVDKVPILETDEIGRTTNPYATSKYIIERMLEDLTKKGSISALCLRYFNPIGAHESGLIGESPNGVPNNLVPYLTQVAVGQLEKLLVYGDNYPTIDGTGVRDYIHVCDLAEGHVNALKYLNNNSVSFDVFNLGTGKGYSVLQLLKCFENISGKSIPYVVRERRNGDIAECWADVEKAKRLLSWQANRSLDVMLRDSWNWQLKNPNGYN